VPDLGSVRRAYHLSNPSAGRSTCCIAPTPPVALPKARPYATTTA
jgi:hypothetical protein